MKKILLLALAMSISAFAADTTINQIWFKSNVTILYLANGKNCNIGDPTYMTAEYTQRLVATALTAKASNAIVSVNIEGANCKNIFLK